MSNSGHANKSFHHKRLNFVINEKFQWRYTSYLVTSVFFAAVITGGVTGYFLNQNYSIFNKLAYFHAPDILPQLEREQIWINSFLVAFVLTIILTSLYFGLRMTSRIAGPMFVLRRHLRQLSNGMFFQAQIRTRDSDEFRELIETYNYFYQSMRAQIQRDINVLTRAMVESDDKARDIVLSGLLKEKQTQLNPSKSLIGTSALSGPNSDSRHAS
jgi:methyl-accepting chemotaxis protein